MLADGRHAEADEAAKVEREPHSNDRAVKWHERPKVTSVSCHMLWCASRCPRTALTALCGAHVTPGILCLFPLSVRAGLHISVWARVSRTGQGASAERGQEVVHEAAEVFGAGVRFGMKLHRAEGLARVADAFVGAVVGVAEPGLPVAG